MCSGKTRVGRALAERLGWPWHDVDREAEALVGPLQPYFASQGEAAFRELEHEVPGRLVQGERSAIGCGRARPGPAESKLMRGTVPPCCCMSFPNCWSDRAQRWGPAIVDGA